MKKKKNTYFDVKIANEDKREKNHRQSVGKELCLARNETAIKLPSNYNRLLSKKYSCCGDQAVEFGQEEQLQF